MYINEKKMAIEMTKKFAAAARKFGTQQYRDLQEARRDYPNFKVVTITRNTASKQDLYKGLTYEFMESYIQKHDDEEQSIMAEYMMLRGKSQDAKDHLVKLQKHPGLTAEQKVQLFMDYAVCCYKLGDIDRGVHLLESQHKRQGVKYFQTNV